MNDIVAPPSFCCINGKIILLLYWLKRESNNPKPDTMKELLLLLKKFFGYTSFRPMQAEIIQAILQKQDSLVLMPTGGGKSICFQLPAIYLPGTAVVISPLIALMKDQVEGLIENGIPAAALNSTQSEEERQKIKQLCIQGKIKLLYISPERLMSEVDYLLTRIDISLIAIDEAHCISQWGHDFRPEYTQLAILKERFPRIPIVALTATADKITRTDIARQLRLKQPRLFLSSFDRPNLSLTVLKGFGKKEKIKAIVQFVKARRGQSGIIYCLSRKSTEDLAEKLSALGIEAVAYHAGMSAARREEAQNAFITDRVNVVCATIAFGMGIDKSNVRWVIHYNMPKCLEGYYQEIGRAGRDGLKSETLLFYSYGDVITLRKFAEDSGQADINREKLERMQRYCESDVCRRRILLNYFNEEAEHDCGNCDVCLHPPTRFDGTILVQKALSGIIRTNQEIGMQMLIDILRGSYRNELLSKGYNLLKTYGVGKDLSYREWMEYLYQMLQLGYMEIDYAEGNTLKVTPLGNKVLYGEQRATLAVVREKEVEEEAVGYTARKKSSSRTIKPVLSDSIEETLFDALKQLRLKIAQKEDLPAYLIFNDKTLHEMVQHRPVTLAEFSEISGVGDVKLEKYGKVFVELIRFVLKLPKTG